MSYSDIYQYGTDADGRIVYQDPEYYLYGLLDGSLPILPMIQSLHQNRSLEGATIRDKYAKLKPQEPNVAGSGCGPCKANGSGGMTPNRTFTFGLKKRL